MQNLGLSLFVSSSVTLVTSIYVHFPWEERNVLVKISKTGRAEKGRGLKGEPEFEQNKTKPQNKPKEKKNKAEQQKLKINKGLDFLPLTLTGSGPYSRALKQGCSFKYLSSPIEVNRILCLKLYRFKYLVNWGQKNRSNDH